MWSSMILSYIDRVSNFVMEDVRLFLSVFGSGCLLDCSFAKTPGAQIRHTEYSGAPGAA